MTTYELFKKHEVKAEGIADFLARYYKPDRYTGPGDEYAKTLLKSHEADFNSAGVDIISHHDSVTGKIVAYYGKKETLK